MSDSTLRREAQTGSHKTENIRRDKAASRPLLATPSPNFPTSALAPTTCFLHAHNLPLTATRDAVNRLHQRLAKLRYGRTRERD